MIIQHPAMQSDNVFARMERSEFEFYLTGSRAYFPNDVNPSTDWDFFVFDSPSVIQFLWSNGFMPLTNIYKPEYRDIAINDVHRNLKYNIDVQIIKKEHFLSKKRVHEFLLDNPSLTYRLLWDLWKKKEQPGVKSAIRHVWNALLQSSIVDPMAKYRPQQTKEEFYK